MNFSKLASIVAFVPALLAQDARRPAPVPAYQDLGFSIRSDSSAVTAKLAPASHKQFLGIVVLSATDAVVQFPGLPPVLQHIVVLGFGATKDGTLEFKVPTKLQMDLNAQSAIAGMNLEWLEISEIRRLSPPAATATVAQAKPARAVNTTN